jgi:hypothetical protein
MYPIREARVLLNYSPWFDHHKDIWPVSLLDNTVKHFKSIFNRVIPLETLGIIFCLTNVYSITWD